MIFDNPFVLCRIPRLKANHELEQVVESRTAIFVNVDVSVSKVGTDPQRKYSLFFLSMQDFDIGVSVSVDVSFSKVGNI